MIVRKATFILGAVIAVLLGVALLLHGGANASDVPCDANCDGAVDSMDAT